MMIMINPTLITNDRFFLNKIARNKEQISGAVTTVEQWNHSQRCQLIEKLVPLCSTVQLDMLWTVLQPSLHRDYFYTVKSHYPNYQFKRISTPHSRLLKECYYRCWDREESFYISTTNDLQEFRDDDGLTRKSQSSFAQYSEDKSTSSISCPTITKRSITEKSSEKNRRLSKSLDAHSVRTKKVQISSDFAPKSVRSVTIRWTDQSIGSFQTAQSTIGLDQVLNWFTHSWSESEQNDFLRRLIVKFDERQQYFTSCVITQRLYRDFICLLPRKLAYQILDHLTPQDLARARRVCKNWKSIIDQEPDLWRPKSRSNQLDENSNNQIDWETFQKQSVLIRRNWAKGTARLIKCSGHKQRVLSICGNETHLATGSLDRTIKIWILKDGQLYQTLHGHNKGVWTLKFISAVLLISGGYDATIKLWNINTTNCLRTLLAHNGPVWSLACSNIYCVSGSQDRTARLWRLPRCELYATLTGHTCSIFGVDLNQEQNLCATASADRTVRLWSLTTRQCLKILYGTTDDHIMAVSLQQGYVAYSFGFRITVYRITVNESEKCIIKKVLETQEHHGRIESLQLILLNKDDEQPSLVSAGQDGLVKFWDLNHIVSQHTFNARSSELVKINCIYVDRTHIVTVGDDCLVKILDFASRIN